MSETIVSPVEIMADMRDGTTHIVRYYREADYGALAAELAACREQNERLRESLQELREQMERRHLMGNRV